MEFKKIGITDTYTLNAAYTNYVVIPLRYRGVMRFTPNYSTRSVH